jgi:beta-lactamase superfamily II metal-dependent hydrolase
MAVFSLEVLQAEQGDCLLIHFGPADAPQTVLVDGGPAGLTYPDVLEPRLRRLAQRRGAPVELPLVVCSHIDDDHIGGVLDLVQAVAAKQTSTTIGSLWHNRPLELVREQKPARFAAVLRERREVERLAPATHTGAAGPLATERDAKFGLVVGSVRQGDDLYAAAKAARIRINRGFRTLVAAPTPGKGYAKRKVGELELTVIGPDTARIDALRKLWQEETRHLDHPALLERSASIAAVVAGETDESVTNLSSIVFVVGYAGRTMLLTGDARGDYIVEGLERAGFLQSGLAKLDVAKLQHHGSARNTDRDFFSKVHADHYVISANGKYGNPDPATFDALVAARGQTGYRVWMTNGGKGTPLAPLVAGVKAIYPSLDLRVRPSNRRSLLVDLGEDPV